LTKQPFFEGGGTKEEGRKKSIQEGTIPILEYSNNILNLSLIF